MTQEHKNEPLACVVLAAGASKRMKSDLPKPLHKVAGQSAIQWILRTISQLNPERTIIVVSPKTKAIEEAVSPLPCAVQVEQKGTGDAIKAALPALEGFKGNVLVLYGDMPLITIESIQGLIAKRYHHDKTGISVLAASYETPPAFGRMIMAEDGALQEIVEDKDCTPAQKEIKVCNMGVYCIESTRLGDWLSQLQNNNAQGEFYATDLPAIAAQEGVRTDVFITENTEETLGFNNRQELAHLEKIVQQRLRSEALANGATLLDPDTVYFSHDTKIGRDVLIEPNVFFGPGVVVEDNVQIKAYCHFEKTTIGAGAVVGPFARLRPGAEIGAGSKIGNFVEIKNATLENDVKVSHLAYIGDANVGEGTNFSCGAVTVNYDGKNKFRTEIGKNVMVGCNANLIAPVKIGDNAFIAGGSTITYDVPADALAIARERPTIKEGWASKAKDDNKVVTISNKE